MSKEVSVAEAKKQLSSWIRSAEHGETVLITRRGKPVAALVSAVELEQLQQLRAGGPGTGLASLAGGWEGSDALVEDVLSQPRTQGRVLPDLE
jgi:prevent-host-death family protein